MAIARDIKLKNCQIYDENGDLTVTAYELSWYLQKKRNLAHEAGRRCRYGACPSHSLIRHILFLSGLWFFDQGADHAAIHTALFSMLTEQAYEKTGVRYFVTHQRDKLTVVPEGGNSIIPMFQAGMLESSSIGESIEDVYTVVTVERYKDDKLASQVTKENESLIKQIGRMQKVIDAGEDKNLAALAAKQLSELSRIPRTRSITVRHQDDQAARLRAGWLIRILEKDHVSITDWIVTSSNTHWKGGFYTVDLQLERRG
ncbi:hypothetical protein [Brevibacillus invocatus]|uniref:XkdQ/YqbQ family protein n=1 Tax=Brevibacillus invocatus TaxID=173959 RepID=UPI001FE71AC4|nr:hypothetical protein [Brevibacillus invocatus]